MKLFTLLCMDAEGVVLCPKLLASALYFKSKLQLHNFTIYDILTHDSTNYVWDETESDLQSSTFVSIIIHHLEKRLQSGPLPITVYSDGCGYQNRNVVMANALRLLAIKYSRSITQKFLEVGHTHMECDSTHACIERRSKGMTFNLPSDFETAISTARDKPSPFIVEHLTHKFFRNYDDPNYLTLKSIRPGKKAGDPKVTDIRALRYDPDGKIFYKLHFDDEFKVLPQAFNKQNISVPTNLHKDRLAISATKWKHLQELKSVIDAKSHSFYDNIPHRVGEEKITSENDKLKKVMANINLVEATSTNKNVKPKVVRENAKRKVVRKNTKN
ncbi:uncharacterized protein LOC119078177 [Bradysia coprophila]|uniref:uncharacterized protein LOC119066755 n=1 Tax=Bradysia coprophila TaxID=38358 RepID=UPI00187DBE01|nr:uncharacterized protein LOC119066755 [Bradysia coprophila]XP_037041545.1 uncharacterized protein LOC119078177 [Bradysia coprophila]